MLLNEFFGKSTDPVKDLHKGRDDKNIGDELFWFIIDHDKLHKDFFHPVASKLKKANEDGNVDKEEMVDAFMSMVKKGCKEFYDTKKMTGNLGKNFSEEMRKDMCERLYDHYKEDVVKNKYKIG